MHICAPCPALCHLTSAQMHGGAHKVAAHCGVSFGLDSDAAPWLCAVALCTMRDVFGRASHAKFSATELQQYVPLDRHIGGGSATSFSISRVATIAAASQPSSGALDEHFASARRATTVEPVRWMQWRHAGTSSSKPYGSLSAVGKRTSVDEGTPLPCRPKVVELCAAAVALAKMLGCNATTHGRRAISSCMGHRQTTAEMWSEFFAHVVLFHSMSEVAHVAHVATPDRLGGKFVDRPRSFCSRQLQRALAPPLPP